MNQFTKWTLSVKSPRTLSTRSTAIFCIEISIYIDCYQAEKVSLPLALEERALKDAGQTLAQAWDECSSLC